MGISIGVQNFQRDVESIAKRFGIRSPVDWRVSESQIEFSLRTLAKGKNRDSATQLAERLVDALQKKSDQFGYAVTSAEKADGKYVCLFFSLIFDKITNDIFEEYIDYLKEDFEDKLKRQKKRKKHELPFPDKPASHPDNRRGYVKQHTEVFSARIDPEFIRLESEFRESTGMSKREMTERALKHFIETYENK